MVYHWLYEASITRTAIEHEYPSRDGCATNYSQTSGITSVGAGETLLVWSG
jgi:hypothetical protein